MNVSDTALMTCLVTSETEGLHVHFVDGGGYTSPPRPVCRIGAPWPTVDA